MNYFLKTYQNLNKKDRIVFYLYASIIIDIIFAIIKAFLGLITPSLWFGANAGFYMIISLSRIVAIKSYQKVKKENDTKKQEKTENNYYFHSGFLLLLLGISYLIISIIMLNQQDTHIYFNGFFEGFFESFHLIYLVAFMAFWKLGSAIYGTVKYKRKKDPIIAAVKMTNYAEALTAIVSTQVALLETFGEDLNYSKYNGAVGITVSIIIGIIGIYMQTRKSIKKETLTM